MQCTLAGCTNEVTGRQKYCSGACKQEAYRNRHAEQWKADKLAWIESIDTTDEYAIYGLLDPRDGIVRYIGMSRVVLYRMAQHFRKESDNVEKNNWIDELASQGIHPFLVIFELVIGIKAARKRESVWIDHYKTAGTPLMNVHGNRPLKRKGA